MQRRILAWHVLQIEESLRNGAKGISYRNICIDRCAVSQVPSNTPCTTGLTDAKCGTMGLTRSKPSTTGSTDAKSGTMGLTRSKPGTKGDVNSEKTVPRGEWY